MAWKEFTWDPLWVEFFVIENAFVKELADISK